MITLSNLKVGDTVYRVKYGWARNRVTRIIDGKEYYRYEVQKPRPVEELVVRGILTHTLEGEWDEPDDVVCYPEIYLSDGSIEENFSCLFHSREEAEQYEEST